MFVKVDIHAHLRAGGEEAMAKRYNELGFDVLVGTDHANKGPDSTHTFDYQHLHQYFDGIILNGSEQSKNKHVNHIESENEVLRQVNHPMRYDLSLSEINHFIGEVDADTVSIVEHARKLRERPTLTEAVNNLKAQPTVSSDAHGTGHVGEAFLIVEVPSLTGDAVLRAIKRGEYALGSHDWWPQELVGLEESRDVSVSGTSSVTGKGTPATDLPE